MPFYRPYRLRAFPPKQDGYTFPIVTAVITAVLIGIICMWGFAATYFVHMQGA